MTIEDVPKPTGDVSSVCWALMGAMAVAIIGVAKWFSGKLDKAESELKEERRIRDQDRKDFEAQTNVMVQNVFKMKKGGNTNDS